MLNNYSNISEMFVEHCIVKLKQIFFLNTIIIYIFLKQLCNNSEIQFKTTNIHLKINQI